MRKVELCTGYTVVDFDDVTTANCLNALTISGDKEVDIASVSAGYCCSNYGDPAAFTFRKDL